jgi:hypothetical protein
MEQTLRGLAQFANIQLLCCENGSQGRDAEPPALPELREFGKLWHSVKLPLQVANCKQG